MKRKDSKKVSIIIGIALALTITPIVILSIPVKNGRGSIQLSRGNINVFEVEVEIHNLVPMGNINLIELNNNPANIIEAEWDVRYTGPLLPQFCILITHTIRNSHLEIYINSILQIDQIKSLDLNISFNPCFKTYSFISQSQKANVNFKAFNLNIKNFDFRSSSGNLNIYLNKSNVKNDFKIFTNSGNVELMFDHIAFSGNFISHSDSGIQMFDMWNNWFTSIADFNVSSILGYIQVYWMNHFNKSQDVKITINTENNLQLKFWCPLEIMRSEVFLHTINGTTRLSKQAGTYEEISENHFQANNLNNTALDSYNITASSTSGEAWVFYVNCFKWSRYCDWTADFDPYNVNLIGNHSLLTHDYEVTTLNLHNLRYIYLNETRAISLNIEILPVSSENLLYIEWEMDYVHSMGIGVGEINMKISNSNISDILNVYVELDFELDKILPTFNDYNVTVFYHPNYTFNQF